MSEKWYWTVESTNETVRIGLTAKTLEELGEISFVDLPKVGTILADGDSLASVEATKAVLDFDTPFAGTVIAINTAAIDTPTTLNQASHDNNWLVDLKK
ncbi:glycine cleavage system protein H [Periweissella fabaria]|uniref:Glycine cleavage system H protein n=1 Tax=Periweissella fabaria TaxID=546157 RepID=A0ABM8Z7G4_9LACO|nr:glycine cleavage system protein H [Periweissella fabaria]MCM0597886.1 glycine cleavage system protein H [Periweissella fabaria]CAH0417337.1 Glycine cleavage system H protein [Periweissella fabaria]